MSVSLYLTTTYFPPSLYLTTTYRPPSWDSSQERNKITRVLIKVETVMNTMIWEWLMRWKLWGKSLLYTQLIFQNLSLSIHYWPFTPPDIPRKRRDYTPSDTRNPLHPWGWEKKDTDVEIQMNDGTIVSLQMLSADGLRGKRTQGRECRADGHWRSLSSPRFSPSFRSILSQPLMKSNFKFSADGKD